MLLALALLLAQTAGDQADQEVVITSDKRAEAEKARRFVERVSEPLAGDVPLARYSDPVCVGSAGLPPVAAQAVVDRVSEVALSVGLRVGEPGCAPNLMVAFVEDSRAELRGSPAGRAPGLKWRRAAAMATGQAIPPTIRPSCGSQPPRA
jgi:hypothetical protein